MLMCLSLADKMLNCLKKSLLFLWQSTEKPSASLTWKQVTCVTSMWRRHESNYNAYPTFDAPSPYKPRKGIKCFYEYKYHAGGNAPSLFIVVYITRFCGCEPHVLH